MSEEGIPIVGMGASTPVGRNVWASAAAVRAGICGFYEHPFMIDTAGEPMRVAMAPWLPVDLSGAERLMALLVPAIDEALAPLAGADARCEQPLRLALALGLPPERPGLAEGLPDTIKALVVERYGPQFCTILAFPKGHAAGLLALDAACRSLHGGTLDAGVVAGVDSYLEPETLQWLEECDQLHGAGPENNAWGFIPGEAAGAVLVTGASVAARFCLETLGKLSAVGLGTEKTLIKTETVCIGEGLTQAFRGAVERLPPGVQVHNVFCDMNGETYRADEYGFTVLRTKERFVSATDFVAPADCWGDVGAAGGLLHATLALISHRKRYGKGPLSLVWASSEGGERGAVIVRALDPLAT